MTTVNEQTGVDDATKTRAGWIASLRGMYPCERCGRPDVVRVDFKYWGSDGRAHGEVRCCNTAACTEAARKRVLDFDGGIVEKVVLAPFATDVTALIAGMSEQELRELDDSTSFWE